MNTLIDKAKRRAALIKKKRRNPKYIRAMEWFGYVGLLRHSEISPRNTRIRLGDLIFAGMLEPRVRELLPAIFTELGDALPFSVRNLPDDLKEILRAVRVGGRLPKYQNVTAKKYSQWFQSPAIELAKKRLSPRGAPRKRNDEEDFALSKDLGKIIQSARIELGFTQEHFSEAFNTSLRALRDLEQGKTNVSIGRTLAILEPLKIELTAAPLE